MYYKKNIFIYLLLNKFERKRIKIIKKKIIILQKHTQIHIKKFVWIYCISPKCASIFNNIFMIFSVTMFMYYILKII